MEKLEVTCELTKPKKCTVSKDCGNYSKEDIISKDFDRLTLKGANGLINGLKSDNFNHDHKIDNKEHKLGNCDENEMKIESTVSQSVEQENKPSETLPKIDYVQYESELQMPMIMKIIQKDLSEPYSIYTYRYFIHNWPKLCFLVINFYSL